MGPGILHKMQCLHATLTQQTCCMTCMYIQTAQNTVNLDLQGFPDVAFSLHSAYMRITTI